MIVRRIECSAPGECFAATLHQRGNGFYGVVVIERSSGTHKPAAAIRSQNDDLSGVTKHRYVGIVSRDNHLPGHSALAHRSNEGLDYERVVEMVFRLIEQNRLSLLGQEEWEHDGATLLHRELSRAHC